MFSLYKKQVLCWVILLVTITVQANEEPKHEEAKPAEAAAHPAGPPVKTAQQEWLEIQAKVQVLKAKIRSKDESVKKLIKEKMETKDPKKSHELVQLLQVEYKDLQSAIQDYDQQRSLLQYRYPEKGRFETKQYERIEIKELEDMEKELSLEGQINRAARKVRTQYKAHTPPVEPKGSSTTLPAKKDPTVKEEKQGPDITEPVIITK